MFPDRGRAEVGRGRAGVGGRAGPDNSIAKVAVVVPVHNEEQHLERALDGVRAAAGELQARRPEMDIGIVVVLDTCTDNSGALAAHIAAADPRVSLIRVSFRNVGRSRRAGIRLVLDDLLTDRQVQGGSTSLLPTRQVWLANTDADSCVPGEWLVHQIALAETGADAVLGTVEPDPEGMDSELLRRWHGRHPLGEGHPHVFGANFGVRASAYVLAGGFPRQRVHEDLALVDRLRRRGCRITSTDTVRVVTSGRTDARAPQGFGAYLLALGMESAVALER